MKTAVNNTLYIKPVTGNRYMVADDATVLQVAASILSVELIRGEPLKSPDMTISFLRMRLRRVEHEIFMAVWLDNRHRVIATDELFRGTIDGASVHPREVVKAAMNSNAAAVIFAHNHPSGIAEPSQADKHITRRLTEALALVDVRVLDHFVIGENEHVSFAERGLL